jgi:uncharacterized protein YndB with AHSA1/START domain
MDATVQQRPSLTIHRHYPAPPEKVWQALITPEGLRRWMGPTDEFRVPIVEVDARVGGKYHILMVSPDGQEHDVRGVYREVSPPTKLVYTWAWKSTQERESLVTVELRAKDGGTDLTLTHSDFADPAARDGHEKGWNGCLARLERYLA